MHDTWWAVSVLHITWFLILHMIHANKIAFINSRFASSGLISEFESPSNFFKCSSYHVLGKWTFFRSSLHILVSQLPTTLLPVCNQFRYRQCFVDNCENITVSRRNTRTNLQQTAQVMLWQTCKPQAICWNLAYFKGVDWKHSISTLPQWFCKPMFWWDKDGMSYNTWQIFSWRLNPFRPHHHITCYKASLFCTCWALSPESCQICVLYQRLT